MPRKKPAPRQEFETALDDALRNSRSLELYAALYPSPRPRVRALLNSNVSGIREKVAAMIAAYANRGRHDEVWLQKRYALTQAEARIALFIGEGGTVAAYA